MEDSLQAAQAWCFGDSVLFTGYEPIRPRSTGNDGHQRRRGQYSINAIRRDEYGRESKRPGTHDGRPSCDADTDEHYVPQYDHCAA